MKFQEKNPSNARILINHKTNKVKFQYPNKHGPFIIIFSTLTNLWIFINLIVGLILSLIYEIYKIINYFEPSTCVTQITNSTITKCGIIPLGMNLGWSFWIGIYIILLYVFLPPLILTILFINNEKLVRNMPNINMALSLFPRGKYYYKEITSLNKKFYEIPIFNNTFLDYKAEGDFSKYLEKVQITDYKLDYCSASIFSKKVKKTKNEYLWKARFIFSEIPKKGALQIKFK